MLHIRKTSVKAPISEDVPETMIKIIIHLNKDCIPTLVDAIYLIQKWLKGNNVREIPRYGGSHIFTVGRGTTYEASGPRFLHPFEQWKVQRIQKIILDLEEQGHTEVDPFLKQVGATDLKKIRIQFPLSLINFRLSSQS